MADNPQDQEAPVAATADPGTDDGRHLVLQKIYLKDCSFESPSSPTVFSSQQWQPKVNLNFQTKPVDLGDDTWEVVLTVTIDAKMEDNTVYLCEVQQAGIFIIKGFEEEERRRVLVGYCPTILFPYAREGVSELVGKGGFPQLLLQPVNFEALYMKHAQDVQQAETEAAGVEDKH